MDDIHKLRTQISSIAQANFPSSLATTSNLLPPTDKQLKVLRQLIASAFIDQVAVRKDLTSNHPNGIKFASSRGVAYRALGVDEDVFIHPTSVLFHSSPPDYVAFSEIIRSSRPWMKSKYSVFYPRVADTS